MPWFSIRNSSSNYLETRERNDKQFHHNHLKSKMNFYNRKGFRISKMNNKTGETQPS